MALQLGGGAARVPTPTSGALGWGEPLAGKGEALGGQGLSLRIDLRVSRGTAWGEAAR